MKNISLKTFSALILLFSLGTAHAIVSSTTFNFTSTTSYEDSSLSFFQDSIELTITALPTWGKIHVSSLGLGVNTGFAPTIN